MISGKEFKKRWTAVEGEDELSVFDVNSPHAHLLPEELKDFLSECGLPESAAPFMSFNLGCAEVARIYEVFGQPSDYSEDEKDRLNRYLVIGSDGGGNPIVLDLKDNCSVVNVSHENGFNDSWFMNTSVFQLAESLLEVRDMFVSFEKSGLPYNEDEEIPEEFKSPVNTKLMAIDPRGNEVGAYWENALEGL